MYRCAMHIGSYSPLEKGGYLNFKALNSPAFRFVYVKEAGNIWQLIIG